MGGPFYEPGDYERPPDKWAETAQAFVLWAFQGSAQPYLSDRQVVYALIRLERAGLIVHPDTHDELADEYAQKLQQVEQAADELTRRLHGDEE